MERERKADATLKKARGLRDLFNEDIGHRPVAEITPQELLGVLKRAERRGHHETAQRLREFAGRIFRYSIDRVGGGADPTRTVSPIPVAV
ncbi:hypothetical protein [Sphingomonas sp.]|uniref:phage integrase central domain-containing protein n=1 Tax=Sphingomonas sp. TaxID=28214 RepID=UPI0025EDFB73|nr:hypothetical protein [Sphingomonas sp.]